MVFYYHEETDTESGLRFHDQSTER